MPSDALSRCARIYSNSAALSAASSSGSRYMRRKRASDRLRIRGKRGRLTYAKRQASHKEATDARSHCRSESGYTPQQRADAPHATHPELVEHYTDGKLAESVGPVVRTEQVAERDVGNSEGRGERPVGYGKVHSVEVIDQNPQPQQPCNSPPAFGNRERSSALQRWQTTLGQ